MSGTGREKGIYSLQNYLQVKAIVSPLKLFLLRAHVILYMIDSVVIRPSIHLSAPLHLFILGGKNL